MVSSGAGFRAAVGAVLFAALSIAASTLAGCRAAVPAVPGVGGAAGAVQQLGPLQRLGQGLGRIRDGLVNRNGNFPGLEKGKRVLSLNDPENLKSDNPAVKTAAEQKQAADEAPQKIKAIKYLGMIGCGCDTSIRDSLEAALDDCDENIRYGACKAFALAAHRKCASCNFKSCCSRKVLDKLWKMGYDRKDSGCYVDPSPKVRSAARQAFKACKKNCFPDDTVKKGPGVPEEGPPDAPPAKAPEAKTAQNSRRIQGSVFHFPGFDWVIEETAPDRPMPDFDRTPTLAGGIETDVDDDPRDRPARPAARPQLVRSEPAPSAFPTSAPQSAAALANRPATLEFDEEDAGYSAAMETLTGEKSLAREAAELAAEQDELQEIAARWMKDQQKRQALAAERAPTPPPAAPYPGPASVSSEAWQAPSPTPVRAASTGRPNPAGGWEGAAAPRTSPYMAPQQVPYVPPHAEDDYERGGVVPASAQSVRRPLPVNAPDPWAAGAWIPPPAPPRGAAQAVPYSGPQYAAPQYALPQTAGGTAYDASRAAMQTPPAYAPQPAAYPSAPVVAAAPANPAAKASFSAAGSSEPPRGGLSAWGGPRAASAPTAAATGPAGLYDPAMRLPDSPVR